MALNPEELEIVNKLKVFARAYGLPVGLSVLLVIASTVGWNFYQNWRSANIEQASYAYQRFIQISDAYNGVASELELTLLNEDNNPITPTSGISQANELNASALPVASPAERLSYLGYNLAEVASILREDHPSSTYASFATLRVAAIDLMNNNITNAIDNLQWVVQKSPSVETTRLAGLMLGRALIEEERFNEALGLLKSNKIGGIETAALSELLGDIYYHTQEPAKALDAYKKALALGANTDIINYKISLLPTSELPVTD